MLSSDFKISSFLPPTIAIFGDKTYIVPGWHKVPNGTTLDEAYAHWTKELPKNIEKNPPNKIYEIVDSSKGDGKQYEVSFDGTWWNCTCMGFSFRKNCRHCESIKEKYKTK